ncbi:hypothetical protein B0H66DRAFT_296729 [Apodospora peruviana]|uniref:Transmembrane protein n=1 Tax=Apodospora peruviana TaxID=516989 RepID=A0AAE0I126_9PEZI|nr:hypothetical protein B0H66DRAFT_296729 [Apodospora peruviana]
MLSRGLRSWVLLGLTIAASSGVLASPAQAGIITAGQTHITSAAAAADQIVTLTAGFRHEVVSHFSDVEKRQILTNGTETNSSAADPSLATANAEGALTTGLSTVFVTEFVTSTVTSFTAPPTTSVVIVTSTELLTFINPGQSTQTVTVTETAFFKRVQRTGQVVTPSLSVAPDATITSGLVVEKRAAQLVTEDVFLIVTSTVTVVTTTTVFTRITLVATITNTVFSTISLAPGAITTVFTTTTVRQPVTQPPPPVVPTTAMSQTVVTGTPALPPTSTSTILPIPPPPTSVTTSTDVSSSLIVSSGSLSGTSSSSTGVIVVLPPTSTTTTASTTTPAATTSTSVISTTRTPSTMMMSMSMTTTSTTTSSSPSTIPIAGGSDGLDRVEIAAIVIGTIIGVCGLIALAFLLRMCIKRRRRQRLLNRRMPHPSAASGAAGAGGLRSNGSGGSGGSSSGGGDSGLTGEGEVRIVIRPAPSRGRRTMSSQAWPVPPGYERNGGQTGPFNMWVEETTTTGETTPQDPHDWSIASERGSLTDQNVTSDIGTGYNNNRATRQLSGIPEGGSESAGRPSFGGGSGTTRQRTMTTSIPSQASFPALGTLLTPPPPIIPPILGLTTTDRRRGSGSGNISPASSRGGGESQWVAPWLDTWENAANRRAQTPEERPGSNGTDASGLSGGRPLLGRGRI